MIKARTALEAEAKELERQYVEETGFDLLGGPYDFNDDTELEEYVEWMRGFRQRLHMRKAA